jgi:hypothetical protein
MMMTREIKFRFWNNSDGVMQYDRIPGEVYVAGDGTVGVIGSDMNTNHFVVEQYTGLKDKNGKEIYEGDIMSAGFANDIDRKVLLQVEYNVPCYHLINLSCGNITQSLDIYDLSELEVIGNIHENPELLNNNERSSDE